MTLAVYPLNDLPILNIKKNNAVWDFKTERFAIFLLENKCIFMFQNKCMYCRSQKEKINPTYFNTNYRREMKLVPIIMNNCLLKFDALKFFLCVHLHGGGSQPNFNFFNVNPQIFQRNRKVHLTYCLETNFYDISIISLRVIRRRNYS